MSYRNLKPSELKHGLYVQCKSINRCEFYGTIYKIIEVDGVLYYTVDGRDWKYTLGVVSTVWYETEETRAYSRQKKLEELGV